MDNINIEELPLPIQKAIDGREAVLVTFGHCSGDAVYDIAPDYILKISDKLDRLRRERDANDWLEGKLNVSCTVCYIEENGVGYYLKTRVGGENLIEDKYLADPVLTARLMGEAARMVHGLDISDCPLENTDGDPERDRSVDCFIHGDLCLPNVMAENGRVCGFIDTETCGVGDPWIDYAECIWSYQFNMGTEEYTPLLLRELGIEFDAEKYAKYRPR